MANIIKPNTFFPNTVIVSGDVNDDFDVIYNDYNGNIDQTNFATLFGTVEWAVVTNVPAIQVSNTGTSPTIDLSSTLAGTDFDILGAASNWSVDRNGDATFNNITGVNPFLTNVDIYNGFDLRLFSDAGVTQQGGWDGATGQLGITSGAKIFLDGADFLGNTSIRESAADTITFEIGGSDLIEMNPSGEMLLPAIDPPTANYINRNSSIKGYISSNSTPAILDDYNVTSIAKNGTGDFTVTWDTNFTVGNHVSVGTSFAFPPFDNRIISIDPGTTADDILIQDSSGTNVDRTFFVLAVGDQ